MDDVKRILSDIRPSRISLVDLGANGETFFVIKSKEEVSMDTAIRDKYVTILSAFVEKFSDIIKRCGDKEEDVEKINDEVLMVLKELDGFVLNAVWTTAYVNNLPDSAFLYVESGGEKDGEGKTVPRTLRHFPYKDAEGKVDLPHLRNAIARIPQAKIEGFAESDMAALQDKARKLLEENTEMALKKSYESPEERMRCLMWNALDLMKANGEFIPDDDKEAVAMLVEALRSIKDSMLVEESLEKRGSKMAASRLARLRKMVEDTSSLEKNVNSLVSAMKSLIEEIETRKGDELMDTEETKKSAEVDTKTEPEIKAETKTETQTEPEKKEPTFQLEEIQKMIADSIAAAITTALAPIQKSIEEIQTRSTSHEEKIEKMSLARGVPKGGNPDSSVRKNAEGETESVFDSIMPKNFRGVVSR